jgi:phage terminase small subunit
MAKKESPKPKQARTPAPAPARPKAKPAAKKNVQPKADKPKQLPKQEQSPLKPLTPVETAFLDYYLLDPNGTQAYLKVKPACSEPAARVQASRLLAKPNVAAELERRRSERAKRLEIDADKLVKTVYDIALVDHRELTESHNYCCRHCWGIDFLYQRTDAEMTADREAHEDAEMIRQDKAAEADRKYVARPFREKGGVGYDGRKDPNPECTNCWGRGERVTIWADTRKLSAAAVALYAGIDEGKDGVKMVRHNKHAAVDMMWKHQGLYEVDNAQKGEGKALSKEEQDALYKAAREAAEAGKGAMLDRRKALEELDKKERLGGR